ncbi:MAG TPA: SRPBCC family protein, partial [Caulobacteraceae bacterium]|nr:SRPBCC family protein [Caulobacteraceae bacterium]
MDVEVENLVGAVVRTVEKREHLGKPARVVVANVTYDTDIDDLWDAITNAERIPRWFLPVTGDLRLGGRYQLQGNAGGVITECEAPRRLAMTWEFGGGVTWLNVTLAPEGDGRATLTLEHIAEVTDEIWNQFGPGAVGVGWDLALRALRTHIATGQPVDPAQAQAWVATAEGKAFVAA